MKETPTNILIDQHRILAQRIMGDKTLSGQVDMANARAEQLVEATRHILCCWLLTDATEKQVLQLAKACEIAQARPGDPT